MTNDNKKNEIAAYQKWQNQTSGRHPDASPSTQVPLPAQSARSRGNGDLPGISLLCPKVGGDGTDHTGAVLLPSLSNSLSSLVTKR